MKKLLNKQIKVALKSLSIATAEEAVLISQTIANLVHVKERLVTIKTYL